MSAELNDTTGAESPAPIEPSGKIELTEREIAIAEGRDPDAPSEEPVETPEVAEEGEQPEVAETPETPAEEPQEWHQQYDRQLAEAYDLDLSDFASRDELSKHVSLLAKYASRFQQPKEEPAPKAEAPAEPEYVDEPFINGKVNVEYLRRHKDELEGSEYLLAMAEHAEKLEQQLSEATKKQEESLSRYEQEAQQREAERQLHAFHQAVDHLNPDFYGKAYDQFGNPVTLAKEHAERRQALFEEAYWMSDRIARSQEMRGEKVAIPGWPHLAAQAQSRLYGAELAKLELDKKAEKAKAQSRNIRPAAGSTGAGYARTTPKPSTKEDPSEIAQDPDVIDAWERAQVNR